MRAPTRVPWSTSSEIEQICSWIFEDETDMQTSVFAIERLSAWKTITQLPYALESTLSILSVIVQDHETTRSSHLPLRQSYANALIRFVNGLVDPMQLSVYARSISSIAAQIGLPPWFVELRHAATHEDLPSLELLRNASRESMAWLLHNYFLPAITPASSSASTSIPPLSPLLAQYKTLMKMVSKDDTIRRQHQDDVSTLLRNVERWMGEAQVAFNLVSSRPASLEDDPNDLVVLDRVCEALLERGMLVPISKKKRIIASDTLLPSKSLLRLWDPFINHVQTLHAEFVPALVRHITVILCSSDFEESATNDVKGRDVSYYTCLASWAIWLVTEFEQQLDGTDFNFKRESIIALVSCLGFTTDPRHHGQKMALAVACRLAKSTQYEELLHLTSAVQSSTKSNTWTNETLHAMTSRLLLLDSYIERSQTVPKQPTGLHNSHNTTEAVETGNVLPPGWALLDAASNQWKPSPIGIFVRSQS